MLGNENTFAMIGMRVVRGPGWKWNEQDGGEGHVGTIVDIGGSGKVPKNTVLVQWDEGRISNYRAGLKGIFDLYVLDSAPAGIKHEKYGCDECGVGVIRGTRWHCPQCKEDLCSKCYMKPAHNTNHKFLRHDIATSEPVLVKARADENCLIQSFGLYLGARVVRGYNWKAEWGNQDGGAGKQGTIVAFRGSSSPSIEPGVAVVKWDVGNQDRYRVGLNGKVDLQCVKSAKGMLYYRSHLPLCGKTSAPSSILASQKPIPTGTKHFDFAVGDRVRFTLPDDVLKVLLVGHGEWNERMSLFRGEVGFVHRRTDSGDVRVQFKDNPRDRLGRKPPKFTFHPAALELVDPQSDLNAVSSSGLFQDLPSAEVFSDQSCKCDATSCQRANNKDTAMINEHSIAVQAFESASIGDVMSLRHFVAACSSSLLRSHKGLLPIHIAAKNGHDSVLHLCKEKRIDLGILDSNGNTAMHYAVSGKQLSTLRLLVRFGAKVDCTGEDGCTPLHVAAREGYVDGVATLLQLKTDPNKQNVFGNTALHISLKEDREAVAELLCSSPAVDCSIRNKNDMTSLHLAALKGNARVVESILTKSPSLVDLPTGPEQHASLHIAVQKRNKAGVAAALINKGASVDILNGKGDTPLHIACENACLECTELLLRNGADATKRSGSGFSSLHLVINASSPLQFIALPQNDAYKTIVQSILRHKLNVNDQCEVTLLIACLLSQHGCALDSGFDCQWRNCLLECSNIKHKNRSNSSTEATPADDTIQLLQDQVKKLTIKLEEFQCQICMDATKDVVFEPCGHGSCKKCAERLRLCHNCRRKIEKKITSYN